jgi:peptide subunit release factor 1 (eRF1)
MISKADFDAIVARAAAPDSPVLSVYLDIDQSKAANLQRHFAAALENMLRSIEARLDGNQLKNFSADAERVRRFVAELEPRAKGLILFCDDSENFFWSQQIKASVRNIARWSDTPYLIPLIEILDEYERYGVVLTDKEHARLFTVFIGEIVEHYDAFAPASVKHFRTTGTDQWLSAQRFQSNAEMHVHWHLKHVAELLDKLVDRYGFHRLLLGGPVEATGALQHLLSKRARARVVERLALPVKASEQEVLEAALQVESRVEREMEKQTVEQLIDANGHHPIMLGLDDTLRALAEERIWRVYYADGFRPRGGQCVNCGMLYGRTDGSCDFCGAAIKSVDDLLERMVERVLEQDGKIAEVAGEAALRLRQAGGIGAVLRF